VEEVRRADAAEMAERPAEILMIAGRENSAAAFAETRDRSALRLADPRVAAGVDADQPELVEVRAVDPGDHRIVPASVRLPVARGNFGDRRTVGRRESGEGFAQQRKA